VRPESSTSNNIIGDPFGKVTYVYAISGNEVELSCVFGMRETEGYQLEESTSFSKKRTSSLVNEFVCAI